jgi:hypothetical protein
MNNDEIEDLSNKVRTQATALLKRTNLEKTLSDFGDVFIHGSYPLNIMYSPDIDIVVKTSDPQTASLSALDRLLKLRQFQKYEYGDFVTFPIANRPQGFIIVLKTTIERVKWELEIWFLRSNEEQMSSYNWVKERLTEAKRLEILKAKHERQISGKSKHLLSSYDLYKQIL